MNDLEYRNAAHYLCQCWTENDTGTDDFCNHAADPASLFTNSVVRNITHISLLGSIEHAAAPQRSVSIFVYTNQMAACKPNTSGSHSGVSAC